jgi:hypothetical protein
VGGDRLGKKELNMLRTRSPYVLELQQQILDLIRGSYTRNEFGLQEKLFANKSNLPSAI